MTKENDVTGFRYKPGDRIRRTGWHRGSWVEVGDTQTETEFAALAMGSRLIVHSKRNDSCYGHWAPYVEPVVHYEVVLRPPKAGEKFIDEFGSDFELREAAIAFPNVRPVVVREWNEPQETPDRQEQTK